MKAAILAAALCLLCGSPLSGRVVHYGPSWGDWTCPPREKCGIAARQNVLVPEGTTPIAHWDCSKLGARGLLLLDSGPRRGLLFPVVVADCTAAGDLETVRSRGIVAEVPYHVASAHGFAGGWTAGRLWLERTPPQDP